MQLVVWKHWLQNLVFSWTISHLTAHLLFLWLQVVRGDRVPCGHQLETSESYCMSLVSMVTGSSESYCTPLVSIVTGCVWRQGAMWTSTDNLRILLYISCFYGYRLCVETGCHVDINWKLRNLTAHLSAAAGIPRLTNMKTKLTASTLQVCYLFHTNTDIAYIIESDQIKFNG